MPGPFGLRKPLPVSQPGVRIGSFRERRVGTTVSGSDLLEGPTTDSFWANVIALFPFNDGSAVGAPFIDLSPITGTQLAAAGLRTTTSDPKYGVSSLERPAGTGSLVSPSGLLGQTSKTIAIPANTPIAIEFWSRQPTSNVATPILVKLDIRSGGSSAVNFDIDWRGTGGGSVWACNRNGSTLRASGSDPAPHATFRHIAFSIVQGGTGYFFVDGVQQGASFAVAAGGGGDNCVIGFFADDTFGAGGAHRLDDLRVTLAQRYTAGFTPPPPHQR